jgi:hypothetical protein
MEVPATPGAGRGEVVFRYRDKTVQVFGGAFTGTLQLEGKIAADEYAPIGPPITAPGLFLVAEAVESLRIRTVALSAGTPQAIFAGFDYRAM